MTAPGPLAKQHDAVFNILNADGTEQPIGPPKTAGQKHAERVDTQAAKPGR
jgi:hypothetical protein